MYRWIFVSVVSFRIIINCIWYAKVCLFSDARPRPRHFRNGKGTGAEIRPAIVSGIVTGSCPSINPRSLYDKFLGPVPLSNWWAGSLAILTNTWMSNMILIGQYYLLQPRLLCTLVHLHCLAGCRFKKLSVWNLTKSHMYILKQFYKQNLWQKQVFSLE